MRMRAGFAAFGAAIMLAGCQSATGGGAGASVSGETFDASGNAPGQVATAAPAGPAASAPEPSPAAFAATASAPAICATPLAGGPPPAPAKGADFAKNAVGKNLARNVGRNVLGSVIGGGAVGGAISSQVVRTEQDLAGKWQVTDGSPNCGCEIQVRTGAGFTRTGLTGDTYTIRVANSGGMQALGCSNPQLAAVARFGLGHTFTGYDAELEIKAKDGTTVAKMKRNGINHFSGALADGTPVTMWRRGG